MSTTQDPKTKPLPIQTTTTTTTTTTTSSTNSYEQTTTSKQQLHQDIQIPDGRKNSKGEELASPTADWKPNLGRQQSWNLEDMKREYVKTELAKDKSKQGGGFSEVEVEE